LIQVDCEQGSLDWFQARLGIPTASNFGKILTATAKKSTSRTGYADQLLADWLAGKPVDQLESTHWMQRGTEMEQQARDAYEFESGNTVEQIGFVYLDVKQRTGCSPDGLIGDDGCWEAKCPKASTLVSYYGKGCPSKYIPQVMGEMWICERDYCDFYAFHPLLMPHLVRVERDDFYIGLLAEAVEKFNEYLNKRKKGLEQWKV